MRLALLLPALGGFALLSGLDYQKPPQAILDVLNAPSAPQLSVSPKRDLGLVTESPRYPSIAEVSKPMLRLAGMRIDPKTNGIHLAGYAFKASIVNLATGATTPVQAPAGARLSSARWSPDGKQIAVMNTVADGIELWIVNSATGAARKVPGIKLNPLPSSGGFGGREGAMEWLDDSKALLVRTIPANRGAAPPVPAVPAGPNTQETDGKATSAWTFQDLLKTPYDEQLFEYYTTSQPAIVDVATLKATPISKPGIYSSIDASPDGKYFLVSRIHKPFSYLYTFNSFPTEMSIWDRTGKPVKQIADLPLAERVPIEGVRTGPRSVQWNPGGGATIFWAEAMDGGNPKEKVPHRDRIVALSAPFTGEPKEVFKTEQRFQGMRVLENGKLALINDFERLKRFQRTFVVDLANPSAQAKTIWARNAQDRYKDPGQPVARRGEGGIRTSGDWVFLNGQGASPEGDRPFLDKMNIATGETQRIWRCDADHFETVVEILDDAGTKLLTRRESPTEPPNYFVRDLTANKEIALTKYADPNPILRRIKVELVKYKRPDGVPLSMRLYLPPDYKPGTRLPALMWSYPREFGDADTAGQVGGSTKRFTTITGASHLFFLLAGYAVLDDATLPVIGDPETMNNTYVEQIVAGAKAAIDKAAEMGYVDPDRMVVGGHSYGGFMTANLLAHSDLFKAGLARSGAYNRTLTPFGFQSERRTFWEAQDVYLKMSPFMIANKIKEPILFIHGEADNNAGTHPIQSERMYQAVRGNGGIARLVMLPHESHGYQARESIEHTLWEMLTWSDKYVKNAGRMSSSRD
jgi:dipeptidyl aminopeptidase/acylaminoacyl peptidase